MGHDLLEKRVAVLGAGKMGGILLQALLKSGMLSAERTCATVQHEERAKALSAKLNIQVGTDNAAAAKDADRSEEHTSELQSQSNLVCRLLLEKKKKKKQNETR